MSLINLIPPARFNNQLILNQEQNKIFLKHNDFFKNSFFSHNLCEISNNSIDNHYQNYFSFVSKSFVYVITESVAEYPYPFFSEKTWKAFLYKMPFMTVGGKGSLQKLRSFGFKTFGEFWDESYDDLEYAADRIDLVVKNIVTLSKLTKNQLDNMHKEMLPLVEYNQNHMQEFYYTQFNNIKEQLENL